MWFNPEEVLKEGYFLNFVTSPRGAGKSFSTLKFVTERATEHGEEFVYIRRQQNELDVAVPTLYSPLLAKGLFEDYEIKNSGISFTANGDIIGYYLSISAAHKLKSVGFPKVKYIIFDEFISESKKYISGEVTKFLSLIETIARMRDDIQIICLANQNTIYNPYYSYFGVRPASPKTVKTRFRKKSILIYQYQAEEYKKAKRLTKFASLISGTDYGGFILDNEAIDDDYSFVIKLPDNTAKTPYCNLTAVGVEMVVYNATYEGHRILYIEERKPVPGIRSINMDKNLKEGQTRVRGVHPVLTTIRLHFNNGYCFFKSVPVKNIITEIFS